MAFTRLNRNFLVLGLSLLGCSPPQPSAETAATLGSTSSESNESESGDEPIDDMGMPPSMCSSEWDCGVGERCSYGFCACIGCGCSQGAPALPGTIEEPDIETEIPVELAPGPDCFDLLDCEPDEYCHDGVCLPASPCMEDTDCIDGGPFDLFCVEGLCKPIPCMDQLDCPETALCEGICTWLELVPDCGAAPSFEPGVAGTLLTPESAALVVLDLNVDGRDDLAVLDDGAVHLVMSSGVGFAAPVPWPADPGMQPISLARANIHGDGDDVDELLVGHVGVRGVEILVLSEAGPAHAHFVATQQDPHHPIAMDLDWDGLPELVSGTALDGPTTSIEAQLGDGTGTFAALWTHDVAPFDWLGRFAVFDRSTSCYRGLGWRDPDLLGALWLDHEDERGIFPLFGHPAEDQMIFDETSERPGGLLATLPLLDRGVLYLYQPSLPDQFIELSAGPDQVALVSPDGQTHHAIIDRGVELGEFVEFTGNPLEPVCRGNLGFTLDVDELQVGDFDGDEREDLVGYGADGIVRVWYSRD